MRPIMFSDTGHWSRSEENHSIMKKTFWHILVMVVVLPSVGLTSLKAVLVDFFEGKENEGRGSDRRIKWECIFLPDSGSFFVNYAATAALAGAGKDAFAEGPTLFKSKG